MSIRLMNDFTHYRDKKYDAILLAGEGESSYKVYHQHKAFLKINGFLENSYICVKSTNVFLKISIFFIKTQKVEESVITLLLFDNYLKFKLLFIIATIT